jgi:hypothetical protein
MKKLIAMVLVLAFSLPAAALVDDSEVEYLGGTAAVKENTAGHFDTTQIRTLNFDYKGGKLEIPYKNITHWEYTRRLARHLGIAPTIVVALVKHLQRRHFFVIDYKDEEGIAQSAVFEVSKDIPQTLEAVLRVRSPHANRLSWQGNDPCKTGELITESCPRPTRPPCAINTPCASPQETPRAQSPGDPGYSGGPEATQPNRAPAAAPAAPAPTAMPVSPNFVPVPQPVAQQSLPANGAMPMASSKGLGKTDSFPPLQLRRRDAGDTAQPATPGSDSNKGDSN